MSLIINTNDITNNVSGVELGEDTREKLQASLKIVDEATKILRNGIPANADSDTVIYGVVKVFSTLKETWSRIVEETDRSSKIKTGHTPLSEVSVEVISLIGNIIGDWKVFFNVGMSRRHLVHEKLRSRFTTGDFNLDPASPKSNNDLAIFIRYKPMELIGDMITCIILELLGGDFAEAVGMILRLKNVLNDPHIYKRNVFERVYAYLEESFKLFTKTLLTATSNALKDSPIPTDEGWSEEMLRYRFLIWFVVEQHLLNIDECQLLCDMETQNMQDVEWVVSKANVLREKRLQSAFSRKIHPVENKLVKLAYSLDPENPFVILSLLDILSDRKKRLTREFKLTCHNLLGNCGKSVHVLLRIAKYFLKWGRDRDFAYECMKKAISLNPKHAQANYMCGKYFCKLNCKIDIGFGAKDSFYRRSITSDMSDFNAVFEYFKTVLGRIRSHEPSSLFADANDSEFVLENGTTAACIGDTVRYAETIEDILVTSYSEAWTLVQRAQLKFLCVLSHFIRNSSDEAIEVLMTIYEHNQIISMIQMLNELCEAYDWDKSRLGFDRFYLFLQLEYTCSNDDEITEKTLDETDEENEDDPIAMIAESDVKIADDPVLFMLLYLLRVLGNPTGIKK